MLTLGLGALRGCEADGKSALPILTLVAAEASASLVDEGAAALRLSPSEYFFELKIRMQSGEITPCLRLALAGGKVRTVALIEIEDGRWRAEFAVEQSVDVAELLFSGAGSFVFGSASIDVEHDEALQAPTLRAGAITLARAAFRKLPLGVRRAMLSSGRRARWLKGVRSVQSAQSDKSTPMPLPTTSNDALVADFVSRAAVARSLRHASYTEEEPGEQPLGPAKLIAFYLPQFHPIAENDAWWGAGFTEWTNVAKAQPQFVGHHQPRLPGELGFYDLRATEVMPAQARLARAFGISAFCFHYYWFAGKRLLERPLDAFVADPSIDIEFCLCWANENWTRTWDGEDEQVLIAQSRSREDHARVFADMARYMDDPRYLKIDGAPVLLVYRPDIIDKAHEMTVLWRDEAKRRGWSGIYLVATSAFRFDEPERLGFDALTEFPPHGLVADPAGGINWVNGAHAGSVFSYAKVAAGEAKRLERSKPRGVVFPGVMPGWDNEARRPGAGTIYHGSTPETYGAWLRAAIDSAVRNLPADRRLVFINAWNEWAEGAYLEPDRKFGRAFLAETARQLLRR